MFHQLAIAHHNHDVDHIVFLKIAWLYANELQYDIENLLIGRMQASTVGHCFRLWPVDG